MQYLLFVYILWEGKGNAVDIIGNLKIYNLTYFPYLETHAGTKWKANSHNNANQLKDCQTKHIQRGHK